MTLKDEIACSASLNVKRGCNHARKIRDTPQPPTDRQQTGDKERAGGFK